MSAPDAKAMAIADRIARDNADLMRRLGGERPLVASSKPDNSRNVFLAVLSLLTIVGLGACMGAGPGVFMDWTFAILAGLWVTYGLSHLTP